MTFAPSLKEPEQALWLDYIEMSDFIQNIWESVPEH